MDGESSSRHSTTFDRLILRAGDDSIDLPRLIAIRDLGSLTAYIDQPTEYFLPIDPASEPFWTFAQITAPRLTDDITVVISCSSEPSPGVELLVLSISSQNNIVGAHYFTGAATVHQSLTFPSNTDRILLVLRYRASHPTQMTVDFLKADSLEAILKLQQEGHWENDKSTDVFAASGDDVIVFDDPAPRKHSNVDLQIVNELDRQKRFRTALKKLDTFNQGRPDVRKLRMKILHQCKDYRDTIAFYSTLPQEEQHENNYLFPYLEALANSGENRALSRKLNELILRSNRGEVSIAVLIRLFPFSTMLSAPAKEVLKATIVRRMRERTLRLDRLLQFTHLCLIDRSWDAFSEGRHVCAATCRTELDHAQVDFLEAQLAFQMSDYEAQEECFNRVLGRFELSPITRIRHEDPISISNLRSSVSGQGSGQEVLGDEPLITVIMTTFNRSEEMRFSIESILSQTWRNVELIIVDDASEDDTREYLHIVSQKDDRVRPIMLSNNGGTYVAKNTGLLQARGDFVTFQDSDDWAHPDKLRVAAERLCRDENLCATTVQHVRFNATDGLKPRFGYLKRDYSSLMFRRKAVLEQIGFFDSVRVGADSEMIRRLQLVFGQKALVDLPHFLSFVDWNTTSLTETAVYALDNDMGVMSNVRRNYQRGFQRWHEDAEMKFIPFPMEHRPFVFE